MLPRLVKKRLNLRDKAPILEALLDLRVVPSPELNVSDLKLFGEEIQDRFPKSQVQTHFKSQLSLEDEKIGIDSVSASTLGYAFISSDDSKISQVQVGGFNLSKLQPYESWDALYTEFSDLWRIYKRIAKPTSVTRVAARFINKIPLPPGERLELSDYLFFHPSTPDQLGDISQFFTRTVLHHPSTPKVRAIVTVASDDEPSDNPSIVFDIDAFSADLSLDPESAEIGQLLVDLREYKNDLFFGAISPHLESILK